MTTGATSQVAPRAGGEARWGRALRPDSTYSWTPTEEGVTLQWWPRDTPSAHTATSGFGFGLSLAELGRAVSRGPTSHGVSRVHTGRVASVSWAPSRLAELSVGVGRLGVVSAFVTYNSFNLRWVRWDGTPVNRGAPVCGFQNKQTYCGFSGRTGVT